MVRREMREVDWRKPAKGAVDRKEDTPTTERVLARFLDLEMWFTMSWIVVHIGYPVQEACHVY